MNKVSLTYNEMKLIEELRLFHQGFPVDRDGYSVNGCGKESYKNHLIRRNEYLGAISFEKTVASEICKELDRTQYLNTGDAYDLGFQKELDSDSPTKK